jgi:hypothetical protein
MGQINVTVGLRLVLRELLGDLSAVRADLANFHSTFSGHTHGGVSTGAGSTAPGLTTGPNVSPVIVYDPVVDPLTLIQQIAPYVQYLIFDLVNLRNGLNAHTHGGVTTGAGTTGPGPTLAAVPVVPVSQFESARDLGRQIRVLFDFYHALRDTLNSWKTSIDAHTHGGVTTGAGSTAASSSAPALTSTAVTLVG